MVEHRVAGDREQPHPQRGQLRVEAVRGPPGPQEGLLHHVLRGAGITEATQHEAVELCAMGGVRGADGILVLEPCDQCVAAALPHQPHVRTYAARRPAVHRDCSGCRMQVNADPGVIRND